MCEKLNQLVDFSRINIVQEVCLFCNLICGFVLVKQKKKH